jgi:hypothetical protein
MSLVEAEPGVEMVSLGGKRTKYPWDTMEVGESFLSASQMPGNNTSMAIAASKKYHPKKFVGGVCKAGKRRVWRTA